VIEALGSVGGPLAIVPLEETFRSPDWRLRAKSASSLGLIGDPSVNEALGEGLADENWWVRRNSAAALSSLPGGAAVLFKAIESPDVFARDAAAEALADAGELAAARERIEAGQASPGDELLVDFVTDQEPVSA
jgi:HEAT repeat protein